MKIISNYTMSMIIHLILMSMIAFACEAPEISVDEAGYNHANEHDFGEEGKVEIGTDRDTTEPADLSDMFIDDRDPNEDMSIAAQDPPMNCNGYRVLHERHDEVFACLEIESSESSFHCSPWGIEDEIAEQLKQSLDAWINTQDNYEGSSDVICTDDDQDCYYNCEGWVLSGDLQDLDDRRASIGNTRISPDTQTSILENDCINEDDELSVNVCIKTLGRERTFPCIDDHIAFVTVDPERPEQHIITLKSLSFTTLEDDILVQVPLGIPPAELICHYDLASDHISILISTLAPGFQDQLFLFENSINGPRFSEFSVYTDETNSLPFSSPRNLQFESTGLAWWEMTAPDEPLESDIAHTWIGTLKGFNLNTIALPRGVEHYRFSYEQSNERQPRERGAYLNSEGSLKLIDRETEFPLFEEEAPFKNMTSSHLLLGLVPESADKLIFSLWTQSIDRSSNELFEIPFTFDTQTLGYQSVDIHAINGMNVLVKLTRFAEQKLVWGVYNATTDHLQTFERIREPSVLERLGLSTEAEWDEPSLHENGISWIIYDGSIRLMTVSF